jgi:hypothetical protein
MHLPPLNFIRERLVTPRLPFMKIRRLRHQMGNVSSKLEMYVQSTFIPIQIPI